MAKNKKSKKIKNTVVSKRNISNTESSAFSNQKIIMDLSFKGLFISKSESSGFHNFLKNEEDFCEQFKSLHKNIVLLSNNTMNELLSHNVNSYHRHCHSVADEAETKLKKILQDMFDYLGKPPMQYIQEIDEATLFQLGEQDSIRFYGTVKDNIFKVYLIDYFHTLYFDEKYNSQNKRNYKYTVTDKDYYK